MSLAFAYPETPPAWLERWPSEAELAAAFPPGIRNYAGRAMSQTPARRLDWTADRLQASFGMQRVTWQLVETGWRRTCTCGYVNDRCVHAYLAARMFNQVLRQENWDRSPVAPGGGGGGDKPAPLRPVPAPAALRPRPTMAWSAQDDLFQHAVTATAAARTQRLEAEADFHHAPGEVTLRFYRTVDGVRSLLRMQAVRNLGFQARQQPPSGAAAALPPPDREFLAWLLPHLNTREILRENLQVLKVPRETFRDWLADWVAVPDRFLDRATQQPVAVRADAARAELHFELAATEDGRAELAAVIRFPDGRQRCFCELMQQLAAGSGQVLVDGQLFELDFPVSRRLLAEIYARKNPRMPLEKVSELLPVLVENRLDLVRGPRVRHAQAEAGLRLEAVSEGADVLLTLRLGQAVAPLDAASAGGTVRRENGGWVITGYLAPELDAVRRILLRLPHTREPSGALRIAGNPAAMAALAAVWNVLPPAVEKAAAPDLLGLLGAPAEPTPELRLTEHRGFVDVQLSWSAAGVRFDDRDVQEAVGRGQGVFRSRGGGWIRLDPEAAGRIRGGFREFNLDDAGRGRLVTPQARRALQALDGSRALQIPEDCAQLARRLRHEPAPAVPVLPAELAAVLRGYQKDGFSFLAERCAWKIGAILADDMGLGKTLQVLAVLRAFQEAGQGDGRALVVCPASVVAVWLEQAERFCPRLRVRAYAGPPEKRAAVLATGDWDLLVTNYSLLRNDIDQLAARPYAVVVLDEAQQIKNPEAQVSLAVRQLRTPRPLALTGTPLENRLLDLWSIMQFVMPGYLGDRDRFLARYDGGGAAALAKTIAPFTLRRLKENVAAELPPRTEEVLHVELGEAQQSVYDARLALAREELKAKGPMQVLAALTRLRQICCDPRLLPAEERAAMGGLLEAGAAKAASAKLDCLLELADELLGEGHSLLVFSQFTGMLDLMAGALTAAGLPHLTITGETPVPERERRVRQFQESPSPQVFLLSLKAAGTGLTLTKADYVVIYDPWWNPAVERQAIDRTHRIGQTRPVMAYRLVATGSVEEKILALQKEKAELFAAVMADAEAGAALPGRLGMDDLVRLLEI